MIKINVRTITIILSTLLSICLVNACKKEVNVNDSMNNTQVKSDKLLYDMSKSTSGFTWFKKSDVLLSKSSGSVHPQSFMRTRYNTIAAIKLDASGRIMPGITFPEGSLIVKELHDNATTLARYAILYKKSDSPDADSKGWVWGYINANGGVAEPASNKGSACISCHSQSGNIDYMLMNKFFQ
jgi:hypothetical protein